MVELDVYNSDLERIAVLQTFTSMLWAEGYNSLGSFTLELPAIDRWCEIFKPDVYVGRRDRKTCMIVKSVNIKDDNLKITGFPASRILDDRYCDTTISNINAESAVHSIIENITPWAHLISGVPSGVPDWFYAQTGRKSALTMAQNICEKCDMGFEVRHNRADHTLELCCYKPVDTGNYKLSTKYGNLNGTEFTESTQTWKNVAIVQGQGEGEERIIIETGATDTVGNARREMVVDARNEQMEEGETLAEYTERLISLGNEKLKENNKVETITFTPYSSEFGKRYDLGDFLTCIIPEYCVIINARITKFQQKFQNNKVETTLTIGDSVKVIRR